MPPVRRFMLRLLSHLRVNRAERELAREIDAHLSLLEDGFRAKGMTSVEARQAARRAFGGVEQAKEHQRDARSFRCARRPRPARAARAAARPAGEQGRGGYYRVETIAFGFFMRALAAVSAVALLLSSAGVYALMSFTLSRRTREIGIRAALGAAPRRIVTTVFSGAFKQIGLGVLAGCVPGYVLVSIGAPEVARGGGNLVALASTTAICVFISVVAVLAGLGPARRALRIHPTDALRAE